MSGAEGTASAGAGPQKHGNASRSQRWLPTLLSVIAGMVDVIGFLSLGIFTAHVTGNIVVIAALIVRHDQVNPAQIFSIPVFILAVTATGLIAKSSGKRDTELLRPLLVLHFLLITCVLIFSAITKPSADSHGPVATTAAMLAVAAMGCQFALLRLTLPVAPSTAVMTGNLTNVVLGLMDLSSRTQPLMHGAGRVRGALNLLAGFFVGCVLATVAIIYLGDWTWALPVALSAAAVALCNESNDPTFGGAGTTL